VCASQRGQIQLPISNGSLQCPRVLSDTLFPEALASYGGLPSPTCAKLKGGYLGSSNPVQIDQFGNNLTSACNVPGGDATTRHDRVKDAVNDLFQVRKLKTKVEDLKFMERELSMVNAELYATFTDNRAKRAAVPAITATIHPMTTECIDTINFGTARTKTANFEV
jgi:hypothetical protein